MYDNQGAVLACKIHIHLVYLYNAHLSPAQRLPADRHFLALAVYHADVHRVGMDILFLLICQEGIAQPPFLCNGK